jgi:hypothetical protein
MTGGTSALLQAQAADGLADELQRRLDDYRQMAENFRAAHASERRLEQTLAPLRNHGYQVLADRRWPGSRNAQVDFLVVGPSGVFIVDAKSWRDVRVERSPAGPRVFQGDDDVTDRFDGLVSLGASIEEILGEVGLAPHEVHTFAVFTNRRDLSANANGVQLLSEADVVTRILSAGRRLPETEGRARDLPRDRLRRAHARRVPRRSSSTLANSNLVTDIAPGQAVSS